MPPTILHNEISRLYTLIDNLQMCVLNLTSRIVELERVRTQQQDREHIRSTLQQISQLQTLFRNAPRNLPNTSNVTNQNHNNTTNQNHNNTTNVSNRTNLSNASNLNNLSNLNQRQNLSNNTFLTTPRINNNLQNYLNPINHYNQETNSTTPDPNLNNINFNNNYLNNSYLDNTQLPQTTTNRTFQNTDNGIVETLEFTFENQNGGPLNERELDNLFTNIFNRRNTITQPLSLTNLKQNTTLTTFNQTFRDNNTIQNNETNQNEENICTICRDTFTDGDEIRHLNRCGHYYHRECIDMWFERHNTCPYCRDNLSLSQNINTNINNTNNANSSSTTSTSTTEQV